MKVIINDVVYDDQETPIVLAFDNDNQRKTVAKHLTNMPPNEGIRLYATYNDILDGHKIINGALNLLGSTETF